MSIDVSVIIPVYNSENGLKYCVDSILNQTLSNLEVILVNDGSTDSSGRLCDEFAECDRRIKVLHTENAGPAAARNLGIREACGEYIGFVDSDDWLEPEMFESLYQKAKCSDSDLTFCDFIAETPHGPLQIKTYSKDDFAFSTGDISSFILPYFFGYSDTELKNYKTLCPFADYCSYVWICLYKTEMIKNANILFRSEKEYYNEDNLFNLEAAFRARSIMHIGGFLYHYRDNSNSFTKSFNKDYLKAKLNKYAFLSDFISDSGLDNCYNNRLGNKICVESVSIINYYASARALHFTEKYVSIRKIVNSPLIADCIVKLDLKVLPFSGTKVFLFLVKQKACFLLLSICLAYTFAGRLIKS
jgi:glycosyltransferase involved in cell wall biosynthesis